jgi:hypothetical protein
MEWFHLGHSTSCTYLFVYLALSWIQFTNAKGEECSGSFPPLPQSWRASPTTISRSCKSIIVLAHCTPTSPPRNAKPPPKQKSLPGESRRALISVQEFSRTLPHPLCEKWVCFPQEHFRKFYICHSSINQALDGMDPVLTSFCLYNYALLLVKQSTYIPTATTIDLIPRHTHSLCLYHSRHSSLKWWTSIHAETIVCGWHTIIITSCVCVYWKNSSPRVWFLIIARCHGSNARLRGILPLQLVSMDCSLNSSHRSSARMIRNGQVIISGWVIG